MIARSPEDRGSSFVIEDGPTGRDVVVTGPWSPATATALSEADGLILNYARGFREPDLGFLREWPLRRLRIIDRSLRDLSPIDVLAPTLQDLSVQAAPEATLNLYRFKELRALSGVWSLVAPVIHQMGALQRVITWRFDEEDLSSFAQSAALEHLVIKEAPHLVSLDGISKLRRVSHLAILLAERLQHTTAVASLGETLRHFELESCSAVGKIDDAKPLKGLSFLGISECGRIDSLKPVRFLRDLLTLHAWGSTMIVDCDLSPLTSLENLQEIRMRDRAAYEPRLSAVKARLGIR